MLTYVEYAALVASPRALPDGLILVFHNTLSNDMPFHEHKIFGVGLKSIG
jgi:hypothetical protein